MRLTCPAPRMAWAVALALLLCGCPRREPPPVPRLVLNLWHTYNPEETTTFDRILERVRTAHPEWRVQVTVIPFARAQNEFRRAAQACGPDSPDLFRAELPWLAEFVSKGLIRPVPASAAVPADLLPAARAGADFAGHRWALPISLDCLALFYDRRWIPRPPSSLDELEATARRATVDAAGRHPGEAGFDPARVSRWGFFVRADAYWFLPFLWASGGDLMDPNTGRVFIDEPAAVAALQRYRDLIGRLQVAPPRPSPSNDYEEQMRRFAEGELAMMVNGPWATAALLGRPGFAPGRLGLAPFPRAPSGAPASPLSGHGYVVSACARAPAAAWQLAQELGGVEAQARFAGANSLLPARAAAYAWTETRSNPFIAGFRSALEAARPRPQHPTIARIFDDFNPAVQAVLLGDASPEEALAGVARAWRRLLGASAARP